MELKICAVGRLRAGPEEALFADYTRRFEKTGRALGLGPLSLAEIDERKAQTPSDAAPLLARAAEGCDRRVALDERGRVMDSVEFANTLARWRDEGARRVAFLIGGADGLDPQLRNQADLSLSFGKMVWPHMLARVMLSEQIYRAAGILAGTPYHRE